MSELDERDPIVEIDGLPVNVVDLFQGLVGQGGINTNTVKELLDDYAKRQGKADLHVDTLKTMRVVGTALDFFKIRHGFPEPGYNFVEVFSGPPVKFEIPGSHLVEYVDPKKAETLALQNPDWQQI